MVRLVLALAVAIGVLAAASCSDDSTPPPPAEAVVAAFLSGNQLTILYVGEDNAAPLSREADGYHPALDWEFTGSGGGVTRGSVIDPRYVVSEFEASGQAQPVITKNDSGMVIIKVPNTGGTLTVNEASAGTLLIPQLHALGTGSSSGKSSSASVPSIQSGSKAQATPSGLSTTTTSGSSGPTPVKIVDNGACASVNILLTSDGYTSSQEAKFNSDAKNAVNLLSTKAGYSDHWKDINVWTLFIASNTTGISDPGCTPGKGECTTAQTKSLKDTAFSNAFGDNAGNGPRRLVSNHAYGQAQHKENYATLASAQQKVQAALPGILCNTSEYGGSGDFGGTLVFTADPSAGGSPFLLAHEAGHALFLLHDEYTYGTCGQFGFKAANTSQSATNPPWKSMINTKQLPTTGSSSSVIGAFEGADYCPTGAYRPQYDCMMRSAGADEQMCAVCRHQMDAVFTQHAGGACGKGGVIGTGSSGGKGKGSPPKKKCSCKDGGGDDGGAKDATTDGSDADGADDVVGGGTGGDVLIAPPSPDGGDMGDDGGSGEASSDASDASDESGEAGQSEAGDEAGQNEAGDDAGDDDDACSCDDMDASDGDDGGDGGDAAQDAAGDGGSGGDGGELGGGTCNNSEKTAPSP
jgi:IgA Peptidase M64